MLLAYFCPSWVSFASDKLDYHWHKHDLFVKKNYTPCLCFSCHFLLYCCIPYSQSISFFLSVALCILHPSNKPTSSLPRIPFLIVHHLNHLRDPQKSLRGEDNVSDLSCTLHHHPKPFWQHQIPVNTGSTPIWQILRGSKMASTRVPIDWNEWDSMCFVMSKLNVAYFDTFSKL
jgi:hypothetical protein